MGKLKENEAYCVRCKQAVKMLNKKKGKKNPNGTYMYGGKCQKCEGKVSRIGK